MPKLAVDTSLVVKWFCEEEDSEKARNLVDLRISGVIQLLFPSEILLECINVLRLGKQFPQDHCQQALRDFFDLAPLFIPLEHDDIQETMSLTYAHSLTSYDACFVAVANLNSCPLITADYKHHKKSISPAILWLSEWDGAI